eukprot:5646592-Alexandrium_andersonii.AAC.1
MSCLAAAPRDEASLDAPEPAAHQRAIAKASRVRRAPSPAPSPSRGHRASRSHDGRALILPVTHPPSSPNGLALLEPSLLH